MAKKHVFKVGDKVKWNDPDNAISSGEYTITDINGEVFTIVMQDKFTFETISEAEVPANEITYIPPKNPKAEPKGYRLTAKECDVLTKIADKSKMDVWFEINETATAIRDLEANGRNIPLKKGIGQLCEGMSGYADYDLTWPEIWTFRALCRKLGIEPPPFYYTIKDGKRYFHIEKKGRKWNVTFEKNVAFATRYKSRDAARADIAKLGFGAPIVAC